MFVCKGCHQRSIIDGCNYDKKIIYSLNELPISCGVYPVIKHEYKNISLLIYAFGFLVRDPHSNDFKNKRTLT